MEKRAYNVLVMTRNIHIFGRQPAISLAELESLLGANSVEPIGIFGALVPHKNDLYFDNLGGSQKAGTVLFKQPTNDWQEIERKLIEWLPDYIQDNYSKKSKIQIGFSSYGLDVRVNRINKSGIILKKVVRAHGYSVRITPNKEPSLNSAQVIRNKLTAQNGLELLLVKSGKQIIVAKTTNVQKIDDYAKRDQNRPFRDQRVGMLPPKLAQTIINLARGETKPNKQASLLDPFCGTGVLLQEALLMNYSAIGTDIEPRMIEYTKGNLNWLQKNFEVKGRLLNLEVGDATTYLWPDNISLAASEVYLGTPFHKSPSLDEIKEAEIKVESILEQFLVNLSKQTQAGFRACFAVPAWRTKNGFYRLKTLEKLEQLGYTRIRFKHVDSFNLIYHRPGQFVARELVVIKRD
jgi:tRNA G10  N-methylase Trm11